MARTGGTTDNEAIRELRDIAKDSNVSSKKPDYTMWVLTVILIILTLILILQGFKLI